MSYCCLQIHKRCRKVDEFWTEMGQKVGHTGDQTKRLFKNLAAEYQKLKQHFHVSGMETDDEPPMLRNSTQLFAAFEEYYQLYYPQGGSTVPQLVVTEHSQTVFSNVSASATVTDTVTTAPSTSGSSQKMPTTAHRKPLKRKRAQPQDSMKLLIQLQNRQLQCERERLRIEREKLASVKVIQGELAAIRCVLCHSVGVSLESVHTEE